MSWKATPIWDGDRRGRESPRSPTSHVIAGIGKSKNLPLINTDGRGSGRPNPISPPRHGVIAVIAEIARESEKQEL
jgi:hypothetical protein